MSDEVLLERNGAIAVITLNRPERSNALSRAVVERLGSIGRELARDPALRVVVLTGAGEKAFCAGADLKERADMSEDEVLAMLRLYRSELTWLESSPVPTLAAINGAALGGGLELALLCDLRIAVETATLGLPETLLGIIPAAGGTQRLPRIIGEARAKELILLGRRLSAVEALGFGLIHRAVPTTEELLGYALEFLRPITEGAPIAQRAALEAIRAAELPFEEGLEVELRAYERCLVSQDRREALSAFREKRKPVFRGE